MSTETKILTIKDLNCGNCIKQYHKECPMYESLNDKEAWRTSEVCGLTCHPLALQVLAQPVVKELETRISKLLPICVQDDDHPWALTCSPNPKVESYNDAIELLKGDN